MWKRGEVERIQELKSEERAGTGIRHVDLVQMGIPSTTDLMEWERVSGTKGLHES